MATKKKKQKADPYLTRAQLAASLKYSPQMAALVELARQAVERRDYGVKSARSTAAGTAALIDQQQPIVQQVYRDAGTVPNAPAPQLPAGTVDFATAGAYEQGAAQHRMSQSMTDALVGLSQQRVLAKEGGQFGALQANQQYASDIDKIQTRQHDLADEEGTFTAKTLMDLVDQGNQRRETARQKQLDRDQSDLNNRRSTANKGKATAKRLPGGAKVATPLQHGSFRDSVGSAQAQVRELLGQGYSPADVRRALLTGEAASTVTTKDGTKVKVPAVPKFKPIVAAAAVELSTGSKVLSKATIRELHNRRLSIKRLGYPTKAKRGVAQGISQVSKPPSAPIRF